ncbi:MAG: hypothetical protein ACTHLN_02155 [Tepidisphaeraceae bacterium]
MPLSVPIQTRTAIRRARQGILLADLMRGLMFILSIVGFVLCLSEKQLPLGTALLFALPMGWFALALRTARGQQQLLRVPALIDAGELEQAEQSVADALGQFSLVRGPRLQALQHLSHIRHQQRNYAAALQIAQALLRFRLPLSVATATRLLMAECALEAGDLLGAHAALSAVRGAVSLRESMKLLELQTEYCVRTNAWQPAIENLPWKVELAELMPTAAAARVQAGLALAARHLQLTDWADWLARRHDLLVGPLPAMASSEPSLPQ